MNRLTLIMISVVLAVVFLPVNAFAEDFYVISVQNKCGTCKGTRSAGGRWCDNGDGTIPDMATCLVWLKYADWGGAKKWEDCSTHDDAHTRSGLLASGETAVLLTDGSVVGDWRLPTLTELDGITDGNEAVLASTPRLFVGVQYSYYWPSTTFPSDIEVAWLVYMFNGSVTQYFKNSVYYVWPVRDAK